MNKLKLNVDALKVDTFVPDPEGQEKSGTVKGHDSTTQYTECTCVGTCQGYGCTPNRPCWF